MDAICSDMATAFQSATAELRSTKSQAARAEYLLLVAGAVVCSLAAFLHYYLRGQVLMYGDAVAHLNIARRVVDSRTPGPLQLGTVWLPLPHILMLPLVWSTKLWQTGIAGSIPSMLAYVAGTAGLFRLVRSGLVAVGFSGVAVRMGAGFAAAAYALNPNVLYLQATAMTEPLYLALFVWATVFLSEFVMAVRREDGNAARQALVRCGLLLACCALTRYDGWYASAVFGITAATVLALEARRRDLRPTAFLAPKSWRRAFLKFSLLILSTPLLWLSYNLAVFGNALEFANGPYSAKGILERTMRKGDPHHPGWESPKVASQYFVKAAILNAGGTGWQQRTWMWFALIGSALVLVFARALWAWLLLWLPVGIYATSIAWGGVPIFVPEWWPFSYYNVRYGTQLLPALFVFGAISLAMLIRKAGRRCETAVAGAAVLFLASSYIRVEQFTPICLREAVANSQTRIEFESKLANAIAQLPADATILIFTGEHGGALQQIGFPLRRTINEGNHRAWQAALEHPSAGADYVVAGDNDPLSAAVRGNPHGLQLVGIIESPGQAAARMYRSTEASDRSASRQ